MFGCYRSLRYTWYAMGGRCPEIGLRAGKYRRMLRRLVRVVGGPSDRRRRLLPSPSKAMACTSSPALENCTPPDAIYTLIAKNFLALLDDPVRRKHMGAYARKRVDTLFDCEQQRGIYVDAYERLGR